MLNLLNYFEDPAPTANPLPLILMVGFIVLMFVMMIIPQRKQKKKQEEMLAKLAVGSIVTTIGGIVGEIVALDDKFIWLSTGTEENKCTIQMLRQAIHAVTAADSQEAAEQAQAEQKAAEEEIDEIK